MQIKLQSDNYQVLLNTLGAELNSYTDPSGKEYVWNSDPTYWLRSSPLLFPTVGNLRNGETVIKNHIYPMPKHRQRLNYLWHKENFRKRKVHIPHRIKR